MVGCALIARETKEGAPMRYGILVVLVGPALALGVVAVIATRYGTLEWPSHPAAVLSIVADYAPAVLMALVLGAGLGRLVARLGDAVESVDPDDPPALLRVAARWRRTVRSVVSDLADKGIGAYRTCTRRRSPVHARSR
jgi:hypothetical protein